MSIKAQIMMLVGFVGGVGCMMLSNILNPPQYGISYGAVDAYWPGLLAVMVMTLPIIMDHADRHARIITSRKYIKHGRVFVLRTLVGLGICSFINAFAFNIVKVLDLLLFATCWFGLAFNYLLNKKRGLPAFYLSRGKRASLLDKVFSRIKGGGKILAIIQVLLMIFIGYLYCRQ